MIEDPPAPGRDLGEELHQTQQYVRLWRFSIRLEFLTLALIGVFAISVAAAFVLLDLGEDDITGGWGYPMLWIISLLRASSVLLPIPGSGLTIAGATFCLKFARMPYFEPLGIPTALGMLVAVLVALTLGPAVLTVGSRVGGRDGEASKKICWPMPGIVGENVKFATT